MNLASQFLVQEMTRFKRILEKKENKSKKKGNKMYLQTCFILMTNLETFL